ncbi:uncharacterized protein [Watersipora subatra]|uniref:uncharacterized protein n=1 Tax=Watersipora subatra TaxID=2589382 RepID=UPI00355B4944
MQATGVLATLAALLVTLATCQVTAPPQYNGQKGDMGNPGDMGISGNPGATGIKGDPGEIGPSGDKGAKGDDGTAGQMAPSAGIPGAIGATGAAGAVGATGATGATGLSGATGGTGINGAPGEEGSSGSPGVIGNTGIKGDQGERGARGNQGIVGEKGEKGEPGEEGFRGTTGPDGIMGYPFQYDASAYRDGCLALQGHPAKYCGSTHYCQDIADSTGNVTGVCRCLDGYTSQGSECKKNLLLSSSRDCTISNGGCQHICSGGSCQCEPGYTLKSTGSCIDIDECLTGQHQCHSSHKCINLIGSYNCLQDPSRLITEARVMGSGLVNGQLLLALLLWAIFLILITAILLIVIFCLKPIKTLTPPPMVTSVEYWTPRVQR